MFQQAVEGHVVPWKDGHFLVLSLFYEMQYGC